MFAHVTMDRPGMISQEYSPDMSKANATPMFKLAAAADNRKKCGSVYPVKHDSYILSFFQKY